MKSAAYLPALFAVLIWAAAPVRAQLSWDTNTGTAGAQGATVSPANWTGTNFWWNGTTNVAWSDGSLAVFGGTAGTVTVNSAVTANGLTFDMGGYTLAAGNTLTLGGAGPVIAPNVGTSTIGAVLGGAAGFTVSGAGTLMLSGTSANSYTGAVTVASGTLILSKTAGIDAITGDLVIGDGIGASGNAVVPQGANDQIANTSNVTVNSDGVWDLLTGNRSEAIAALTLIGGRVQSGTGTITIGGPLTTNASATTATISGLLSLGNATRTFNIADGTATSDLTISAVISNGGITKTGAGTLTLTGANTFSSPVAFNAGTISVADVANAGTASPLGTGTMTFTNGTFEFSGPTDSTNRSVSLPGLGNLASIDVTTPATVLTMSGAFSGNAGLTKLGPGTLLLSGSNTAWTSAPVNINAGTLRVAGGSAVADGGAVTLMDLAGAALDLAGSSETIGPLFGGGASGGNVLLGSGTLTVNSTSSTTYNGVISGSGGLTKASSGTLTLGGTNTFTGTVTISGGSISIASLGNSTVNGPLGAGSSIALTGGTLIYTGPSTSTNRTISTTSASGGVSVTNAGTTLTLAGVISGAGDLFKNGPGTLELGASNTFSGDLVIGSGVVKLGAANRIPNSAAINLTNVAGVIFDLNGNNDTVSEITGGGFLGGEIQLNGGATLTTNFPNSGTITFDGKISGDGNLTKTGIGTLDLHGLGTFTGTLTINGGSIQTTGTGALSPLVAVVIGSTGNFDPNAGNSIGSLAGNGSVTLSGTLTVGNNNTSTTYGGTLAGPAGLNKVGTGTLRITAVNSNIQGVTRVDGGVLQIDVIPFANPFNIQLANVAGAAVELINSANFNGLSGGGPNGGNLILGAGTLALGINTPSSFGGSISGSAPIQIAATGTLTLTGSSTFTGPLTINAGTLRVGGGSAIGDPAPVTISPGAIFDLNGSNETIGSLAGGGSVTLGSGTLSAGTNDSSTTFSGGISGSGGLAKFGTGTFTLSGTNNFTGPVNVDNGILRVGGSGALPNVGMTLGAGTLDLNGTNATLASLAGPGSVLLGAATLTVESNAFPFYQGSISGTGGLVKTSAGTLTLRGTSSFTGPVIVENGVLRVSHLTSTGVAGPLGSGSSIVLGTATTPGTVELEIFPSSSATDRAVTLNPGGGIVASQLSTLFTLLGPVSGPGSLNVSGGQITLLGNNTYAGATNVLAGELRAFNGNAIPDGSALTLPNLAGALFSLNANETIGSLAGGGSTGGNVALGSNTLSVGANDGSTIFSGTISGTGGLTKVGTGTLSLTGANTYSGATTISAGTLRALGSNAIGDASAVTVGSGATLVLAAAEQIGSLAGGGTVLLESGALTVASDSSTAFSGSISGPGGLTKQGTGTLTLSGTASYIGATTIAAGTLTLDSGLGSAGAGLAVNATLNARNVVNRAVSGSGTIVATGALLIGDVNSTSGYDFSGLLTMNSNLVVLFDANAASLGASTTVGAGGRLSAPNGIGLAAGRTLSASANATIEANFANNGSVNGPSAAGQFLTFTGDVNGAGSYTGNVLFSDGFSPGMSAAEVSFENFNFDSTTALTIEIGGTTAGSQYDVLRASGSGTLDGALSVWLINGFQPQPGHAFTFIQSGALAGAFDSMTLPALDPGLTWNYSQTASAAVLVVVPEPGLSIVLATGAVLLVAGRRRRACSTC